MHKGNESILDVIIRQRLEDVEEAKHRTPLEDLKKKIDDFHIISFYERVSKDERNRVAVLAEVKRASPSKGDIAPNIDAAKQGFEYATSGAAVISCLTEPKWFKGTLEDMKSIRLQIETLGIQRPALLRKDFIIDEYQIYEARSYGADTILIIVAAFYKPGCDTEQAKQRLRCLIDCSRKLNMEPLVEVNSSEEMNIALELGALVIGINNRNLHTFSVDLDTTTRLVSGVRTHLPKGVKLVALSGIASRKDVEYFENIGVEGVLVGESLMRAANPSKKIKQLRGEEVEPCKPLIKICGIKDPDMAIQVAESGADLIGLIFVESSKRNVTIEKAKEIAKCITLWKQEKKRIQSYQNPTIPDSSTLEQVGGAFRDWVDTNKPLLVGVFADDNSARVNRISEEVPLDIIQLSGNITDNEKSFIASCNKPILKAIHVTEELKPEAIVEQAEQYRLARSNSSILFLLDTMSPHMKGGTGQTFNWRVASSLSELKFPYFLAGGLSVDNIRSAVEICHPFGVDVSSGVETDGSKDITKVKNFISNADVNK